MLQYIILLYCILQYMILLYCMLQCTEIADVDVKVYDSPAQLVSACDIVLACLADPFAVKEVKYRILSCELYSLILITPLQQY